MRPRFSLTTWRRDAPRLHEDEGRGLVAQAGKQGPTKVGPASSQLPREVGVLAEEPVARMHQVAAGAPGQIDEPRRVEGAQFASEFVRLVAAADAGGSASGRRVHRDGAQAERSRGPDDTYGDLVAVGGPRSSGHHLANYIPFSR